MAITNGLGPIRRVNGLTGDMAGRMNKTNVKPEFRIVPSPMVSLQDFTIGWESAPLATLRASDSILPNAVVDSGSSTFLEVITLGVRTSLSRTLRQNVRALRSFSFSSSIVGLVFKVVGAGFLSSLRLRSVFGARFSCLRSGFFGSSEAIASDLIPTRSAIWTNSILASSVLRELRDRLWISVELTRFFDTHPFCHVFSIRRDYHEYTTIGGH